MQFACGDLPKALASPFATNIPSTTDPLDQRSLHDILQRFFSFLFFPFLCEPSQSNSWMPRALLQIYFSWLWWKVCVLEPLSIAEFIFNNKSILVFQSPYAFLTSSSTLNQSRTEIFKLLIVGHHLVHVLATTNTQTFRELFCPPVSMSKSESLLSECQSINQAWWKFIIFL